MTNKEKKAKEISVRYEVLGELYGWLEGKINYLSDIDVDGNNIPPANEWELARYEAFKYLLDNIEIKM